MIFDNLPIELEYKIYFFAHPKLSSDIQKQIKNYKKPKIHIRFSHPIADLLYSLRNSKFFPD